MYVFSLLPQIPKVFLSSINVANCEVTTFMTTFLFAYLVFLVEILDTNNDTINNMGNFLIKKKKFLFIVCLSFWPTFLSK